ncbi:MAG: glycosyl hydrolase [Verrucomicrobiales bacterium]
MNLLLRNAAAILLACCLALPARVAGDLESSFKSPPAGARPWVFWFWINGNISREGITKDLEAMKNVGIGGVIWMEVSGPRWAPRGPIEADSKEWHDCMQWAITEADRLGLAFTLSVDFGYGSGGPHITPDTSMQKLVWSETKVRGGGPVTTNLPQPVVETRPPPVWLHPDERMLPDVATAIERADSFRDARVFAYPAAQADGSRLFESNHKEDPLETYDGRGWLTDPPPLAGKSKIIPLHSARVVDLTDKMNTDGHLRWNAPPGEWTVVRLGHATNLKTTRPVPSGVLGLECDRLHPRGIDAHFEHRLKPILDAAGEKSGRTLQYIHIDSWEAHGQNWTSGFAGEFKKRRGYDLTPWLPVLTGHAVGSLDLTERFLRDLRRTVGEVTLANYIDRLRQRIEPYGVKFSTEPYGRLCVNSLDYGGRGDFPIAEFWTEREFKDRKYDGRFPDFHSYWYHSMKGLASVANTHGKARVGAEAFTGCRGWIDHPYLIKGMGDEAFSEGVSHFVIHLSAHQAYDSMKPGLTHSRWGQHFNRHQTWWEFSKPWFDYVARCQFLLQQGRRVVDIACLYHGDSPLNFNDIQFDRLTGYDHDFCSEEVVMRLTFADGRIHLPSGISYRYLVLPRSGRLTLPVARKIGELREAGAAIFLQAPITGTPGLEGYPQANDEVKKLAANWPLLPKSGWNEVFTADRIPPDFEGEGLKWLHRRTGNTEIYFVANTRPEPVERECLFRSTGKAGELWNPETGEIHALPSTPDPDGRTRAKLRFSPAQSWFVVFRDQPGAARPTHNPFAEWKPIQPIDGAWSLSFDPAWGTKETLKLDRLASWSEHTDPLVRYYSGTATYRTTFELSDAVPTDGRIPLRLDLGQVEVVARVKLNGKDCGIAWKPPYQVDASGALRPGSNALEIEVANTWNNRLIGDEHLPLDSKWKNPETLLEWPDWFRKAQRAPGGRFTFTTNRHYTKDSPLQPAGLLGPVRILSTP